MSFEQRIGRFFVRLATILIVAGLLLFLPDSQNGDILRYKNAMVVLVAIVAIGKILYDTFFYDRFQS
jgi:hypothetical protein